MIIVKNGIDVDSLEIKGRSYDPVTTFFIYNGKEKTKKDYLSVN